MATKLEIHEAKENEKWTRQDEINDRLEELVEKNTEAINSLNMTIANSRGTLKAVGRSRGRGGIGRAVANSAGPKELK